MQNQRQIILTDRISLGYSLPDHLKNCDDIESMRIVDLENLDMELREKGSSLEEKTNNSIIWRKKFPGMVLDAQSINVNFYDNLIYMNTVPIHPHRADLAFKKDATLIKNSVPITVTAVLETTDSSVILGIRGGSVGVGKIGTIPGGHAEYKPHMTDLIDHLSVEFEEELGYTPSETEKISLIGVFLNRDTNGVNALYKIRTCLDYPEIKSRWQRAKDKYEHQSLIRLSRDEITSLTENEKLAYENVEYTTTPFFIDSLVSYMRFAV